MQVAAGGVFLLPRHLAARHSDPWKYKWRHKMRSRMKMRRKRVMREMRVRRMRSYLIFVTTITTAGCVNNLANCKFFQLECEKLLYTQFCRKTTFVANLLESKISWPEIAVATAACTLIPCAIACVLAIVWYL